MKDNITKVIVRDNRIEMLFNRVMMYSLPGITAIRIIDGILDNSFSSKLKSSIKSCKQLLSLIDVEPTDANYKQMFATLKKIGFIAKINGSYVVNPVVETNYTREEYEPQIEFYNAMLKNTDFISTDLEELRRDAVRVRLRKEIDNSRRDDQGNVDEQILELASALEEGCYTVEEEELYDIAFGECPSKNSLKDRRNKTRRIYSNQCRSYIRNLIDAHVTLLIQQGLIGLDDTRYTFYKHSLKDLPSIPAYNTVDFFTSSEFVKPIEASTGSFEWYQSASDSEKYKWIMDNADNYILSQEYTARLEPAM